MLMPTDRSVGILRIEPSANWQISELGISDLVRHPFKINEIAPF